MTYLLDKDPQRERKRQHRILDALEAVYEPRIRSEIAQSSQMMVAMFQATGGAPAFTDDHYQRMEAIYRDMVERSAFAFGNRIVTQGKDAGLILETKSWAEFFQRIALEYLAQEAIRRRITQITETTRDQIVSIISRGQREGLGVDAIAKNVNKRIPVISRWRAAMISRTETHGAANYGAQRAASETGLKLRKEWISVEDSRTRDFGQGDGVIDEYNHRSMNGQIVDMDQPFQMPHLGPNNFILAMFPGDPALPPAASINCRCAIAHIVIRPGE